MLCAPCIRMLQCSCICMLQGIFGPASSFLKSQYAPGKVPSRTFELSHFRRQFHCSTNYKVLTATHIISPQAITAHARRSCCCVPQACLQRSNIANNNRHHGMNCNSYYMRQLICTVDALLYNYTATCNVCMLCNRRKLHVSIIQMIALFHSESCCWKSAQDIKLIKCMQYT